MSLKLYFLRHGQTAFSRDNAFCGAGLNPELTADGQAMAECFGKAYQSLPWAAVYASPLKRTIATAKPLCDAIGAQMELREDLMEIRYGKWEGKSIPEVTQEFHDDYIRWSADPAWNGPTEGEQAVVIARRALQVVEEIRQKFTTGNVLVVSHKATIRIILSSLLGIDVGRFRYRLACPVGSVSQVEFTHEGPLLHTLADRAHLDARLRSSRGT
ncbi:MAG TPA: histidine phosphatase family protein [Verrucomicrobiae bacterium]|jgi:probable phosphoglycerate mutase|nr:histidine phosphatase family protein [Verrucomicrobiae bacterium]